MIISVFCNFDGLDFVQGSFKFFKEKCESSCFSFGLASMDRHCIPCLSGYSTLYAQF
jgi:hypothetical protein